MNYQTFQPHPDLASVVKCYWTLEIPAQKNVQRQLIIPDGCIEMFFILGDDVKRYASENDFIIQPREMILGQITDTFYVQPTGSVNSFAVRFYPYGFANFSPVAIKNLSNKETPLAMLFGEDTSSRLREKIIAAKDTKARIEIIEEFLLDRLAEKTTIDNIVKATIDTMLSTSGSTPIKALVRVTCHDEDNLKGNSSVRSV